MNQHLLLQVILMLSRFSTYYGYTFTVENDLRTLMYTTNSYQMLSRPDSTVNTTINLMPITLNYLNIKDQAMSITGYYTIRWTDSRFNWSSDPTYNSIPYIFSTSSDTWRPTLIIANAVSDVSILNDEYNMMRINQNGVVLWYQMLEMVTHCECDTTYYPFDTQKCSVILTTWSYTSSEVALMFDPDPVIMDFFQTNGEWEYRGYKSSLYDEYRTQRPYNMAKLEFRFRRRPEFMIMNTIIPVVLVAILSSLIFKLPADTGEKIGYCLTVMLAYAVYLTLVSDYMPTTSVHTSVLNVYNVIVLAIDILSVPITLFVMQCHHAEPDKPVPKFLASVTTIFNNFISCRCCQPKAKAKVAASSIQINVKEIEAVEGSLEKKDLTWQDVGQIWDKFFFLIYAIIITTCTVLLMLILFIGYTTSNNS